MRSVKRQSLVEQAIAEIRESVVSGQIRPGERVDETVIAQRLGISRASLREALFHLSAERLLERRTNYGTFVRDYNERDARDLFIVRLQLEPLAARLAAVRITDEEIDELDGVLGRMNIPDGEEFDFPAMLRLDAELHLGVMRASGNQTLLQILQMLSSQVQLLVLQTGPLIYHDVDELAYQHVKLLEALRNHDPQSAEAAAREHIEHAAKLLFHGDF
jgi:DNA-binding GntR family transcriptional regulator